MTYRLTSLINLIHALKNYTTLDFVCSQLHTEGVGAFKKSARVISNEDEDMLWETTVVSFQSPKSLQNLLFFYTGLHLCLRGVQEHHDLKVHQFRRHPEVDTKKYDDSTYYEYVELISKNNQHRFKDIHMKNKTVKVYAIVGSDRCYVKMLDFYLSKLTEEPKSFYLRPLKDCPKDDTKPWYVNMPVGVNTLKSMLPKMSEEAGTINRYTNHSLRATSASRLFASGIPEKIIQDRKLIRINPIDHSEPCFNYYLFMTICILVITLFIC